MLEIYFIFCNIFENFKFFNKKMSWDVSRDIVKVNVRVFFFSCFSLLLEIVVFYFIFILWIFFIFGIRGNFLFL